MSPEQFGPYRLDALLGRGGMGEVFRAYDTVRRRTVALKRLAEGVAGPEFEARFRRESELAARLSAPHVVPIHDYGEIDGRLFIDMRLVEGRDLGDLLAAEGRLAPHRAVHVVAQLASALDAAHAAGLVHRDVKPSNALVATGDFVYLVDFGIVTTTDGAGSLTSGLIGTLAYVAPERLAGLPEDRRGDVYSLACVLYECLTGVRPFRTTEQVGLIAAHLHTPPPRPGDLDPALAAFDGVVARGMAKDPAHRPGTAGELAAAAAGALARMRDATPVTQAGWVPPAPPPPPPSRSRATVVAAVLAAVVVSAGATVAVVLATGGTAPAVPPTSSAAPAPAVAAPVVVGVVTVGGSPTALSVTPDGRRVYALTGGERDQVVAVDLTGTTAAVTGTPIDASRAGGGMALSPDGAVLYLARCGANFCAVDEYGVAAQAYERGTQVGEEPGRLVLAADGRRGYVEIVTDPGPGPLEVTLTVVDLLGRSVVGEPIALPGDGSALAVSPAGDRLYAVDRFSGLSVIDTVARTVVGRPVAVGDGPTAVAVSPDGARVYVAGGQSDTVVTYDPAAAAVTGYPITVGRGPSALAVSPDGTRLYVANRFDGTVSVIDTGSGAVVGDPVPVGSEPVAVAVSPDGAAVYVANAGDGTVTALAVR